MLPHKLSHRTVNTICADYQISGVRRAVFTVSNNMCRMMLNFNKSLLGQHFLLAAFQVRVESPEKILSVQESYRIRVSISEVRY